MTKLLELGSTGDDVLSLTNRLKNAGYDVIIASEFTANTRTAVLAFQRDSHLVEDGIVGAKTLAKLSGKDASKFLRQSDLECAATSLDCELAAIMAVNQVESRGRGFHSTGKPIVLFERHIMRRRMLANGLEANAVGIAEHAWPNLVSRQTGGYKGGQTENYRLKLACEIHEQSALESASWGQFQIMGFHWQRLGFTSIKAFVEYMSESEGLQLEVFVRFITADPELHKALKEKDWASFARRYNGKAYKKNRYDEKLAAAYAAAEEIIHA
jgi:hypothetical protein